MCDTFQSNPVASEEEYRVSLTDDILQPVEAVMKGGKPFHDHLLLQNSFFLLPLGLPIDLLGRLVRPDLVDQAHCHKPNRSSSQKGSSGKEWEYTEI